jgi:hypothetical protein
MVAISVFSVWFMWEALKDVRAFDKLQKERIAQIQGTTIFL